jgi:Holliday junction resolvase-like predicted endonuclease
MENEILKSSRHSKITGDFGEAMVLYWLSKHGFECARVDHTGIDLIARNPGTDELMGISVKSRSRSTGKERVSLSITNDNFDKVRAACKAFGCVPYFALVVDADDVIRAYIMKMEHLLEIHPKGETACAWSMRPKAMEAYAEDPAIMGFEFHTSTLRWWKSPSPSKRARHRRPSR